MSAITPRDRPRHRPRLRNPFVPVPLSVFDMLPSLTGAEAKVLLVVIRQTLGWAGEGLDGRKESDWISHSQFKGKTGLAGEAVSKAIDSLVRSGLVEAENATGRLLSTPADRRGLRGRVYYRPGSAFGLSDRSNKTESGVRFPKTTKDSSDKRNKAFSFYGSSGSEPAIVVATDSLGRKRRVDLSLLEGKEREAVLEAAGCSTRVYGVAVDTRAATPSIPGSDSTRSE